MPGFINIFLLVGCASFVLIFAESHTDFVLEVDEKWVSYSHDLSGAGIKIENNKIFIINFTYDGLSPDAYFFVGDTDTPSSNGTLINFESGNALRAFNTESFYLDLPENVNPEKLQWLAVQCELNEEIIGYVPLKGENGYEKHEAIKINDNKTNFVQLEPFLSDSYGFRSGPILLVNEGTFFVTNFVYNGKAPDARFWIGTELKGEENFGILLLDENQTNDKLKEYSGKDFYITLPKNLKARDYKYFGVWSMVAKRNVGYTEIPKDFPELLENNGKHEFDQDNRYIARLPKCCANDEVKSVTGCKPKRGGSEINIDIHEGNFTEFNDEPLKNVTYMRYYQNLNCEHHMYHLDTKDKFYLLTYGIVLFETGDIMKKDVYCVDYYNSNSEGKENEASEPQWLETIFICFPEGQLPEFIQDIYVACIYISAIFLFLTTLIFIKIKKARDVRGFNVVGYSLFMSVSFTLLATVKLLRVKEEVCVHFSYLYQFFIVSSFMWLFFLTYETYHRTTHFQTEHYKGRFYYYGGVAFGIPLFAVIVSVLVKDSIPEFSNRFSEPDPCWFRSNRKVIFYYLPIMLSIILNFVFCILTYIKIKKNDEDNHQFWVLGKTAIKNVFRSCYLQLSVMTLCWTVEILSFFFETNHGFWIAIEIINSLQGLFVFIIFILHDPVIDILRELFKNRIKQKHDNTEDLFIDKVRPPSMHLRTLTSIDHAESIENLCSDDNYDDYEEKRNYS